MDVPSQTAPLGNTVVAISSGANMDFDRLRFVSERADSSETLLAVRIPERPGAFRELYSLIRPRNVTEFSYRMRSDNAKEATIYLSFQVRGWQEEGEKMEKMVRGGMCPQRSTQDTRATYLPTYLPWPV